MERSVIISLHNSSIISSSLENSWIVIRILQPDTLSQFAMLNLMMYLAINRKLDQLPFYHTKSSMKMAEVFNEIDAMLDKMTDDSELEELLRMSELVFMHMKMNIENKLPD